jgi:hypothetical protein
VVSVGLAAPGPATYLRAWLVAHDIEGVSFWAIDGDTPARTALKDDLKRLDLGGADVHVVAPGGADDLRADTAVGVLHLAPDLGPTLQAVADRLETQVVPGGIVVRGDQVETR